MGSVLTASALLNYLEDGVKAQEVQEALQKGCVMSALSWLEVLRQVSELGIKPDKLIEKLEQQGLLHHSLQIIPFTYEDAVLSVRSKPGKDLAAHFLAKRLKFKLIAL